jgi:hypothetical protein
MNQLAPIAASQAPALIAASGPRASYRFLEFFTANIRKPARRPRGFRMPPRQPTLLFRAPLLGRQCCGIGPERSPTIATALLGFI